jgi:TolC family type I secretion outer membrane protein
MLVKNLAALAAVCVAPLAFPPALAAGGMDALGIDHLTTDPFVACRPVQEAAAPLSLMAVADAALCANPQTREVWANARVQAAQVGVARAAYLPSLSASLGSGRARSNDVTRDQRSLAANLSWLIFDFGGRGANLEAARQLLAAANASQDATVQSLLLAATQAFYQVQALQASLAAAQASERAAETSFRAAAARYQAGSAAPADQLQARTAWSQAQLNRIAAEGNLKTAQGNLNTLMGRDAQLPIMLADALQPAPGAQFELDVQALVEQARQLRPDLKAAMAQARAAQAGIAGARAAHLPSLSLAMSASDTYSGGLGDNRNGSLGLTLNVPLFAGFATHYKVRAAEAQAEARLASQERLRLQVAQEVWNAYQALLTATQSTRSSADLLASAEQSDQVARGRYQAGVGSLVDLLNAQSALASARQQRVQALFNWNTARAALAQSIGTLDGGLIQTLQEGKIP